MVAVCLWLAACTALRLGYDSFPTWGHWQLDGWFDLGKAQSRQAEQGLESLQSWHRRTQLPEYARLLRRIEERIADGVDPTVVSDIRSMVDDRWRPTVMQAADAFAPLALTLEPAQLARMQAKLRVRNDEYRREHLSPDPRTRRRKRLERMTDRAEYFFGALTAGQKHVLEAYASEVTDDDDERWTERRLQRQARITAAIERVAQERPALEVAQRLLREAGADALTDAGGRASADPRDAPRLAALITDLVTQAERPQRERLSKRLRGLADDFDALAAGGHHAHKGG